MSPAVAAHAKHRLRDPGVQIILLIGSSSMIQIALLILVLQSSAQAPVILGIGDSMTAGYGVAPESSYPAQLEQELRNRGYHYRVVNQGVTGSTTTQALSRLNRALAVQPEIVIIQLGGND